MDGYLKIRGNLGNLREKLSSEVCKIAYMGSSVTVQKEGYRIFLHQWLKEHFKQNHLEINASIGGVGGLTGVFTMDEDVLPYQPDLCFIEYMVSDRVDRNTPADKIGATIEGIVRKLKNINCEIIFLYRYLEASEIDYLFLKSFIVHERVAEYYNISSINICGYIQELIDFKRIIHEDYFKDKTHTDIQGAKLIAEYIGRSISHILDRPKSRDERVERARDPIYPNNYQDTKIVYVDPRMIKDKHNYTTGKCSDKVQNQSGDFKDYNYFEIDSTNEIQFSMQGELVGMMVIVGRDSGVVELKSPTEQTTYMLWDQWCHYDRFTTIIIDKYYDKPTPLTLRITEREIDYSKCRRTIENPERIVKKLKIVGLMVRQNEQTKNLKNITKSSSTSDKKEEFASDILQIEETAKQLEQKQKWSEVIPLYQQVIQKHPNRPGLHVKLAKCFEKVGNIEAAIQHNQQAVSLNPKKYLGSYENFSHSLLENESLDFALLSSKSLENCGLNFSNIFYLKLGKLLLKANRYSESLKVHKKVEKIYENRNKKIGEEFYVVLREAQLNLGDLVEAEATHRQWVERHYLISHKHKVIYCPIAKNACTLFKKILVETGGSLADFQNSNQDIHQYIKQSSKGFQLTDFAYINNSDYFKFVILRNPFSRLVSAYLNKFVRIKRITPIVRQVITDVYKFLGKEPDFKKSISFNQFINYLSRSEDYELNDHWRPQYTFLGLGLVEFDLIIQLEKLELSLERLETQFQTKIENKKTPNQTQYGILKEQEDWQHKYPHELRLYPSLPQPSDLYTPELEGLVRTRYAKDIQIYEKEFNVKL